MSTIASPPVPSVISEVTRRALFDDLRLGGISWSGRLDEPAFLSRLYDLKKIRSNDSRYASAAEDIWQHRVRNSDWDPYWVFGDDRFNLMWCPDDDLVSFLTEILHPVVRPDAGEVDELVELFNSHLVTDGWQVYPATTISARPVFAGRRVAAHVERALDEARSSLEPLGHEYVARQITRMQGALHGDPDLAIGGAKELIETVCKSIISARGGGDEDGDVHVLLKRATVLLRLAPEGIPDPGRGAEILRVVLKNLGSIAGRLAELRNLYGTGHGKDAQSRLLGERHARLAVAAAAAVAAFLAETHAEEPLS